MDSSWNEPSLTGPEEAPDLSLADYRRPLKALDRKWRNLPKHLKTPSMRRRFQLRALRYLAKLCRQFDLNDGDLMHELIMGLERLQEGNRDPLFALSQARPKLDDKPRKLRGDPECSRIEASVAAAMAFGRFEPGANQGSFARAAAAGLFRAGYHRPIGKSGDPKNPRPYTPGAVIKWLQKCRRGQHAATGFYKKELARLRRSTTSSEAELARILEHCSRVFGRS
jgi:hypothetical protein